MSETTGDEGEWCVVEQDGEDDRESALRQALRWTLTKPAPISERGSNALKEASLAVSPAVAFALGGSFALYYRPYVCCVLRLHSFLSGTHLLTVHPSYHLIGASRPANSRRNSKNPPPRSG